MSNTWKEIVDSRIDELKQRKDLVIKDKYIFRMMDVLGQIMTDDMPAPDVVPTYEGGVQFEWHEMVLISRSRYMKKNISFLKMMPTVLTPS